mmetsp:Transcript_52607/g.122457  ORF Transcript_52607/g.122457 Transcript_52607/m.122457 type:complete len:302 (-) Transcript_52607:1127-2032(-)
MDDPMLVLRRDLHSRVSLGRCGASDQQRSLEATGLHLLCHIDHLVQRGRDEPRQPNDIDLLLDGSLQDLVTRHHHAHVDNFVVVAAEDDTNNVLADVVHITLDGGHEHDAVPLGLVWIQTILESLFSLLLLHEGRQVGHGLLHDTCTLDDLGQEHLPGTEEITNDAHALHQWPLDHVQGDPHVRTRLLDVPVDELVDAVDQPVVQALHVGAVAPSVFPLHFLRGSRAGWRGRWLLHALCEVEEPFDVLAIGRLVEDNLLAELPRVLVDVNVPWQRARVDDGHVETLRDGVVEEDTVHGVSQ